MESFPHRAYMLEYTIYMEKNSFLERGKKEVVNPKPTRESFREKILDVESKSQAHALLKDVVSLFQEDQKLAIDLLNELKAVTGLMSPGVIMSITEKIFSDPHLSTRSAEERTFQGMIIEMIAYGFDTAQIKQANQRLEQNGFTPSHENTGVDLLDQEIVFSALLDFKNKDSFKRTEHCLNMFLILSEEIEDYSFSKEFKGILVEKIRKALEGGENFYFLKLRADLVLNQLEGKTEKLFPFETGFYEIEPGTYSSLVFNEEENESKIVLLKKHSNELKEIFSELKSYEKVHQELQIKNREAFQKKVTRNDKIISIVSGLNLRREFFEREYELFAQKEELNTEDEYYVDDYLVPEMEKLNNQYALLEDERYAINIFVNNLILKDDPQYFDRQEAHNAKIQTAIQKIGEIIFQNEDEGNVITKEYFGDSQHASFEEYLDVFSFNDRSIIEKNFGVKINELPIKTQAFLFSFLRRITTQQAYSVQEFSKKHGVNGFKTFLSLEHGGQEMGENILALGENLPEQEAKELFDSYGTLIDTAERLTDRLTPVFVDSKEDYQRTLALQIQDALLLRAKDVLLGAEKITREKQEQFNVKDVTASVEGVSLLVAMIADLGEKSQFQFEKKEVPEKNVFKFRVSDKEGYLYDLKFFVRPEAEKNAQARINIELSFDTEKPHEKLQKVFYNEVVSHRQNKVTKRSVLRIGIDREEFEGVGHISLDMGRSEHADDAITRTGDTFGNLLALASRDGHHTTSPFDTRLADTEVFKDLALQFQSYIANQASQ